MLTNSISRELYAAFVCYHGALLYGLDMAFTSYFVESPEGFNVIQEGLLGSFSILFRGLGSFISACIVDRVGLKATLFIGFLTSALAWLAIFFSNSFELLLIGRILSGISIALTYASNVAYMSEVSHRSRRGTLVAMRAVVISFGMNLVTITAYFCHWKWVAMIGLVLCVSGSIQLTTLPESKYWLIHHGRQSEALNSAIWFSPSQNINDIQVELKEIECSFTSESKPVTCDIFCRKKSLKALLACILLVILIAGTGRMAIISHIEHFIISFQHAFNSRKLVVVLNVTEFFVCLVYMMVVDKFNRKSIMHFTLYVMAFSLMGILFYDLELRKFCISAPMVPILLIFVYLLITVTGLMACLHIILSEVVANQNRASVLNLVNGVSSLASAAYSTALPYVLKYIDVHYTMMYFLLHVALLIVFVQLVLPETRGKALHECGFEGRKIIIENK